MPRVLRRYIYVKPDLITFNGQLNSNVSASYARR